MWLWPSTTASPTPDLDSWVDVTVHERDGRYVAAADLAEDSRDVGDTPQEAVRAALRSLGEPYASEVAEGRDPTAIEKPPG